MARTLTAVTHIWCFAAVFKSWIDVDDNPWQSIGLCLTMFLLIMLGRLVWTRT